MCPRAAAPSRRTSSAALRRRLAGCMACAGICLCVAATPTAGQTIDRNDYLRHLPAMPRLVAQTEASARLHLYGDPADLGYRDEAPADGIDDTRGQHLLRIATRFAPILRRNNFSAPRHFTAVFGGRPVLQLDTWTGGKRVRSDSILLFQPASSDEADEPVSAAAFARSDTLLRGLLDTAHPQGSDPRIIRAEGEEETVLFFDFPGEDEKSWRLAYRDARDSGIYAHFFIHENPASALAEAARYTMVIQYWFFYPFNDAMNNHEGDWEHIAVLVALPGASGGRDASSLLTQAEVAGILDHRGTIAETLVIREVEYYFHESVMTVDYRAEPAPARSRWQEFLDLHVWEQSDYIDNVVQERRRAWNGRLATHPIGFIGGNNKGPDELTNLRPRFGGSFNRNGHGTYPFPGTWQHVGPLGATEHLSGRDVPRTQRDAAWDTLPLGEAFEDDHFLAFEAQDILLVPDWERIAGLVLTNEVVQREWSWLLLPIRWGFPASASPGGGAVEHVDVGQVAPEGPPFQPTWNRLAAEGGFSVYSPRVMRALFVPMTPWDRLSSGWGFLNIPKTLLGFMPGWNVAMAQLGPWLTTPLEAVGAPPPKTFAPERRPYRFSSTGIGWHRQFGGDPFARMLPQPGHALLAAHAEGAIPTTASGLTREAVNGARAWLTLHYGPRFSLQNTYARSKSVLSYGVLGADSSFLGEVRGTLDMKEITGGFRYRLASGFGDATQLFAGAGWGWTWYNVEHVGFRDAALPFERAGGYPVSILPSEKWWPNTWYGVAGIELLAPRERWFADRVGYGLQLEYTGLLHRLGATRPGSGGSLGSVARREIAFGAVVSW